MHAAVLVQAPTGKISYVIGGLQMVKNKPKVTTVQAAWRDLFHKGHLSGYSVHNFKGLTDIVKQWSSEIHTHPSLPEAYHPAIFCNRETENADHLLLKWSKLE